MQGKIIFLQILGCLALACAGLSPEELVDCRADIAFVLDGSGSVKLDNWVKMLEFVWQFANKVPYGGEMNHFGVVSFGNLADVVIYLDDYANYDDFKRAVQNIRYKDENTNTADGLRKLRSLFGPGRAGDRPNIPDIGIILSDGVATREMSSTLPEAQAARLQGINLFGLGIGAELDLSELNAIVDNPDRVFTIRDFDDLLQNVDNIVGVACKAAPEPTLPPPYDPCYKKDIALVLDASGSITEEHFKEMKEFAKSFLQEVPIGQQYNQIALVKYSTESFIHMKLGEKSSYGEIAAVIDSMELVKQRTNVSGAIKLVHEEIFGKESDRSDAENVAIVVTDGKSNTDVKYLHSYCTAAKKSMKLFAVGVGLKADLHELSMMASSPKYHYTMMMDDFAMLSSRKGVQMVKEAVCMYSYPNAEIQIDPEECYSDIVFAIDSTSALGRDAFDKQKQAIKDMASKLGKCLYGVVVMGRQGYSAIPFDSYESLSGFLFKVDQMPYNPEQMDIGLSLEAVVRMFQNRPESISLGSTRVRGIRGIRGVRGVRGIRNEFVHSTAGVRSAENKLAQDYAKLLVVMTAGRDLIFTERIDSYIVDMKKNMPDVGVMAIGIGEQVDMDVLKMMASKPASMFVMYENSLDDLLAHISVAAGAVSAATAYLDYICNFEVLDAEGILRADTCDMYQDLNDNFDWLLGSEETPSLHTGPKGAFNGTHYAYIEASVQKKADHASLIMPQFNNDNYGEVCLGFYYNMHGWHTGKLEVFERSESGDERVHWSMYGPQGQDWMFGVVQVKAYPGMALGFRAIRADEFSGDIALDSVTMHYGPCPVVQQFPSELFHYHWEM